LKVSLLIALSVLFINGSNVAAEEGDFASFIGKQQKKSEEPAANEKKAARAEPKKKAKKEKKKAEEPAPRPEPEEAAERTPAPAAPAAPTATATPSERALSTAPGRPSELVKNNRESLIVKTGKQCLVVEFDTLANGMLSCSEPVTVQYTRRNCASSEIEEEGDSEAHVNCPDKKKVELRFRTSQDSVLLSLRTRRQNDGRLGIVTHHQLESAAEEESSLSKLLAAPKLRTKEETKEESPLKLKLSGFATIEAEETRRFGFDGTGGQQNFDQSVARPAQSNLNFFSNIGVEASRDRTSLVSLFEIGEIYFGNAASGGGVGARATNAFEVRNLYLDHGFSDALAFKGGLVTTASDPRSFIFNDHIATVQSAYKTDLSEGLLWYGEAAKHRNVAGHVRDQYIGAMGTLGFLDAVKATVFGLQRRKNADELTANDGTGAVLVGDSVYHWLGATVEAESLLGMTTQFTAIRSWTNTSLPGGHDKATGGLLDLKLTRSIGEALLLLTVEGLYTTGGAGTTDASTRKQIRGRRNNFVSPVGAAYLFSIATSDGVDDSPGTPKESIIANLGQDEGLRIVGATVNTNLSRNLSGFLRFGYIGAGHAGPNGGKLLGLEYDAGLQYQLTTSTALLLDYGYFKPGNFYIHRNPAKLAAAKLKYSF
jgi:hypothetical protein